MVLAVCKNMLPHHSPVNPILGFHGLGLLQKFPTLVSGLSQFLVYIFLVISQSPSLVSGIYKAVVILTGDRPDLSSNRAPQMDRTVTIKREQISGHEFQRGLDASHNVTLTLIGVF
jgi:hypothetical protein